MFSDTLRPVLFCPPSIDGFSTSSCGEMYPPGASTGTSTSTDDASTIEASSPSASVSAPASDVRREHITLTERKVDTREGNDNKDMDGCYTKDRGGKKDEDRDSRGERGMDRDNDRNKGMGVSKETVVSRLYREDNASGWNVRSSPHMKSESVDTYQVPALQANRYLKAGSSSDDYTDMTHISVDNHDGSESVSFRMEQFIQEAATLQVIDTETAQERQRRIFSLVTRPKASRLPEMVGKYGIPLEPVADAEPSYSTTLATCKPSNAVLSSLDGAKRRVSFCTANADCAGVARTLYKDDSDMRTQDRMLAKLLQNKEVEIGSIKQLMGLGNFQAQLMGSRSGVRSMRKRLEEEIVQQRAPYEENEGGAISQSTRTRRAMSALTYLRSSSHKHFPSPRRHSTNSGLLTLDQQMQLGDMMLHIAETEAPDIPFCNPIFDPSRYAASSSASSAACTVEAPAGEVGVSAVRVGETTDPTAASLPAGSTSRASGSSAVARKKAPKSNSSSVATASSSGTSSKSKASTRPVSRKFKLIRELADFARRQSEESILANEDDPDQSVASMDHLYTLTVPGGAHSSSLKRHSSSASLTTSTPSSSIDSPSPSRASTPHLDDKPLPLDCAERVPAEGASASAWGEGQGQGEHIPVAESHLAKENSKKYQFWLIVVQILSIKNLMSVRVADQIEEARVCVRKGHVRAANRIGACYLRYFKMRMNRLMAVYRRDHKAARRPIRLMVRDLPCPALPVILCAAAILLQSAIIISYTIYIGVHLSIISHIL